MNGYVTSILLAFSAGILGAFQGTINSQIGKVSGQYGMIIGVSLVQAIVAGIILMKGGWHIASSLPSPWIIVAGGLGVIMMFSVSSSISSIGTLSVFILVISGQIISSSLIDHFGVFGPARPLTLQKIGSIVVIMIGVISLVKASS
jgi:bacterial/archaeal transporter family-2 protein